MGKSENRLLLLLGGSGGMALLGGAQPQRLLDPSKRHQFYFRIPG
jgi:hypothetical protein